MSRSKMLAVETDKGWQWQDCKKAAKTHAQYVDRRRYKWRFLAIFGSTIDHLRHEAKGPPCLRPVDLVHELDVLERFGLF